MTDIKSQLEFYGDDLTAFMRGGGMNHIKNYRDAAKKRGKINTPSYHQVIQPIYTQADQRWKKYHKYLKESEDLLREKIENY